MSSIRLVFWVSALVVKGRTASLATATSSPFFSVAIFAVVEIGSADFVTGATDFDVFFFFPNVNKPICVGSLAVVRASGEEGNEEKQKAKGGKSEKAKKRVGADQGRFLTDSPSDVFFFHTIERAVRMSRSHVSVKKRGTR